MASKSGGKGASERFVSEKMRELERCLDFTIALSEDDRLSSKEKKRARDTYGILAYAWIYLGAQCRHWRGFTRKRDGKRYCPICGTPKKHLVEKPVRRK